MKVRRRQARVRNTYSSPLTRSMSECTSHHTYIFRTSSCRIQGTRAPAGIQPSLIYHRRHPQYSIEAPPTTLHHPAQFSHNADNRIVRSEAQRLTFPASKTYRERQNTRNPKINQNSMKNNSRDITRIAFPLNITFRSVSNFVTQYHCFLFYLFFFISEIPISLVIFIVYEKKEYQVRKTLL